MGMQRCLTCEGVAVEVCGLKVPLPCLTTCCCLQYFSRLSCFYTVGRRGRKKKAPVVMVALTPGHLQSVFSRWINISVNFSLSGAFFMLLLSLPQGATWKRLCSLKDQKERTVSLGLYILDEEGNANRKRILGKCSLRTGTCAQVKYIASTTWRIFSICSCSTFL